MSSLSNPFLIGVTGTIGSGKSLVGNILTELNVFVIDSDHIVHEILDNNDKIKEEVIKTFGEEYKLNIDNNKFSINRKLLGNLVFSNSIAKKNLEKIVHPQVLININEIIYKNNSFKFIACLIPLLFENNLQNLFNEIWTVYADKNILQKRLLKRDKISIDEINNRINSQLSQIEKMTLANFTINNSFSKEETKKQVVNRLNYIKNSLSINL